MAGLVGQRRAVVFQLGLRGRDVETDLKLKWMKIEEKKEFDPDVIRTRSLLIWSQTRYHCATESRYTKVGKIAEGKEKLPSDSSVGFT